MNDIYKSYCAHNNPIGYQFCPGCRSEKAKREAIRYEQYWRRMHHPFSFDPFSVGSEDVVVEEEDEFKSLRDVASATELKREYYRWAKRLHPDRPQGSTQKFQRLQQLYESLMAKFP